MFHPRKKHPLSAVVPGTYYIALEYYTHRCTYVLRKTPGIQNTIPGGYDNVPSPEKTFHTNVKPERDTKKIPGGKCLQKLWRTLPSRGPIKPSPGGHLSTPPARRSWTAAPVLSPDLLKAAVWGGRGVVVRP